MNKFNKILIANRGEIAVRIIKAAQELGIATVAIYSEADKDGLHIELADEAWCIGEEALAETYLNVEKIIDVAIESACDAIHPGYGFLAENPQLVAACEKNHITFIGPSVKAIQLMGNKIEARAFVDKLGVPMTKAVVGSTQELLDHAKTIDLPILVKAAAGGGGKGMRIVRAWSELEETIESTSREALSYFGDGEVFIEKYVEEPRHIEIQILGDTHANIIHLYERECSIQRRYQKIIEESPSPTLNQEVREKMGAAAVDIARAIGYYSAGTIEFLVDKDLNFYFLEMNTRVQVEHPVTEMVTGVDIVQEQILIAAGETLSYEQEDIHQFGHAIEARVYAEEPENDFRPAPGSISFYQEPCGQGIRVDAGIDHAVEIKSFFDPMISKLIVWDENREKAIKKVMQALDDYVILGISTNIPFMLSLMKQDAYVNNTISTKYCDVEAASVVKASEETKNAINPDILTAAYISSVLFPLKNNENVWSQIGYWRMNAVFTLSLDEDERVCQIQDKQWNTFIMKDGFNQYTVNVLELAENSVRLGIDDEDYMVYFAQDQQSEIDLWYQGQKFHLVDSGLLNNQDFYESTHDSASTDVLKSPMPGKVIKVLSEVGGEVKKGDVLLIVEAMKMENNLIAPRDGKVESVNVKEGEMVDGNKVLLSLEKMDE
jgi:acetyl-CoA carboxylase biotin carboxylase subunit